MLLLSAITEDPILVQLCLPGVEVITGPPVQFCGRRHSSGPCTDMGMIWANRWLNGWSMSWLLLNGWDFHPIFLWFGTLFIEKERTVNGKNEGSVAVAPVQLLLSPIAWKLQTSVRSNITSILSGFLIPAELILRTLI